MRFLISLFFVFGAFIPNALSKEAATTKHRVFVDTVRQVKDRGTKMDVTFLRAAAVYEVERSNQKLIKQLVLSHKNKKAVEVTADIHNNNIVEVKGP